MNNVSKTAITAAVVAAVAAGIAYAQSTTTDPNQVTSPARQASQPAPMGTQDTMQPQPGATGNTPTSPATPSTGTMPGGDNTLPPRADRN